MMSPSVFSLLVLINAICASPKDRVGKEQVLSNQVHFKKLDEHNPEYDHEAFVGEEAAREFEHLTPEQSKERLGELFPKVDKDGDGFVTDDELKAWIELTQNKYIWKDSERQMKQSDLDKDGYVTWDEYKKGTYGFLEDDERESDDPYKDMISRDKRRMERADSDKDNKLSPEEFTAFLHPENYDHMKDLVITETLEDIDKDKDGVISLKEYIGDLWPKEDRENEEPEWVKTEREQFANFRDKNKDGTMDKEEVADWILPPEYDHVTSEVQHLILESDADKDGKISKEEMVEKFDLFVGSQATDFGEALKYNYHEDL